MKKIILFVLTLCLLLSLTACGKEAPAVPNTQPNTQPDIQSDNNTEALISPLPEPAAEVWYAQVGLSELCLTLSEDGRYTLTVAGEEKTGEWTTNGGDIFLDGDETASFFRLNNTLSFSAAGVFLRREKPELGTYTPAELLSDAPAELLNGYWKSLYVESGGVLVFAEDIGDHTDLYVESPRAALGGPLFGDVIVDMTEQGGALSCTMDGSTVTLALQQDNILRLNLSTGDGDMTLYCLRYATGDIEDAEG